MARSDCFKVGPQLVPGAKRSDCISVIAQAAEIFEKGGSSWLCTGPENWACSVLIILLLSRRASPFCSCAKASSSSGARVRRPDVSILTANTRQQSTAPLSLQVPTGHPAAHLLPRLTSTSPSSLPPATAATAATTATAATAAACLLLLLQLQLLLCCCERKRLRCYCSRVP